MEKNYEPEEKSKGKELAVNANTKHDYIAQLESGRRNPSLKTLLNIVAALDVSADHLLYGRTTKDSGAHEGVLKDFVSFLSRRSEVKIKAYYEIIKFISNYF